MNRKIRLERSVALVAGSQLLEYRRSAHVYFYLLMISAMYSLRSQPLAGIR